MDITSLQALSDRLSLRGKTSKGIMTESYQFPLSHSVIQTFRELRQGHTNTITPDRLSEVQKNISKKRNSLLILFTPKIPIFYFRKIFIQIFKRLL